MVMAIFNTEAGLKISRRDVYLMSWLADAQPIRVSVKAAGDISFRVEVVIRLSVKIGVHIANKFFGFAPMLATRTIFGTAFTDKDIHRIETKSRQNIPKKGHAVARVASFDNGDAVRLADGNTTGPVCITNVDTAVCRVAKARTVPPFSAAPVLVLMEETGKYMVEARAMENDGNRLSIAKEIVQVFPRRPFHITVANTSKVAVRLSRNMIEATLGDALSKIVPVQEQVLFKPVNAVLIYESN